MAPRYKDGDAVVAVSSKALYNGDLETPLT